MGDDRGARGQNFLMMHAARLSNARLLGASVAKGFVVLPRIEPGKAMLVRTVTMLTKLLERFDPEQFRVRESPSDPVLPFEHAHAAAVATLWRALARCEETPRGWPRRRPCEVETSTISS